MSKRWGLLLSLMVTWTGHAQDTQVGADPSATEPAIAVVVPAASEVPCCPIADGTPIVIEILDAVSSGQAKRGDKFRIRLAEPLILDGTTVIAAGIEGTGEVVHAERSRGGGKPGELILAARELVIDGVPLRLRGLKLGGAGEDRTKKAMGVAIAVGVFAFLVDGKEIVVPAGTRAQAKITAAPAPQIAPLETSPQTQADSAATAESSANPEIPLPDDVEATQPTNPKE